jgi:hypothetical protein
LLHALQQLEAAVIICAAGDIHGALDRMYTGVLAFELALAVRFEWVLHVGDFGAWPDPDRIDKATKKHDGAGNFPAWFAERRSAPRKTLFIKGNHEDFVWLDAQHDPEVLPGVFYLRNGRTMDLGEGHQVLRVGGVGGCFGPSNFERRSSTLQGYAKRHYTRDEIETLSAHADLDIVLTHEAPACASSDTAEAKASSARPLDSTSCSRAHGPVSASSATITRGSTPRSRACAASGSTRGTTPAASSPSR